jgi:hypothetical protein
LKGFLSPGLCALVLTDLKGIFKSWGLSHNVGWNLKGYLSPGLCPLVSGGI